LVIKMISGLILAVSIFAGYLIGGYVVGRKK
jgi:hypothetical protein